MKTTLSVFMLALAPVVAQAQSTPDGQAPPADSGQKQQVQKKAPAKPVDPQDAEIQRLLEERKRIEKQKEIEKLKRENEELEKSGNEAGKPPQPPTQTVKPLSPEDADLQAAQQEHERLVKQQAAENLRKQNEAMRAQQQADCVPAPPAKPCGWLCREQAKLQKKADATLDKQVSKAGDSLNKNTKGAIDGSDLPSAEDVAGAAKPEPAKPSPCPAGFVPRKQANKEGN